MIFRASSCKGSLIRKNLSQFWLLSLGLLVLLFVQSLEILSPIANNLSQKLLTNWSYLLENYAKGTTEIWTSIALSALVFSYLHKKRKSSFFHSIPCTRDDLFLTGYISGILFYALPWLLITLISAIRIFSLKGEELFFFTTFVKTCLYRLFLYITFFGFATLGMVLSGRTFFGVLATFLLIVIIPLVEIAFLLVGDSFLFGVPTGSNFFTGIFSPLCLYWPDFGYEESLSVELTRSFVYVGVSVLLAYVALRFHRKRKEEHVGQSLVFPSMLSIVQIPLTFILSLLCLIPIALVIAPGTNDFYVHCLILGSVPAFFFARMLLLRSRKVFQKKAFVGCTIYVLVLCAVIFAFQFDVFGIVRKVPEARQIQEVHVNLDGMKLSVQTQQDIAKIRSIHRDILHERSTLEEVESYYDDNYFLNISYELENGRTIERRYTLSCEETHNASVEIYEAIASIYRQEEHVAKQLQLLREETVSISFAGGKLTSSILSDITLSTLEQQTFFRLLEEDLGKGIDPLFLYCSYGEGKCVQLATSSTNDVRQLWLPDEATATHAFLEEIKERVFPTN